MPIKSWHWTTPVPGKEWKLLDGQGRLRCSIWMSYSEKEFVWHTWNVNGTGGENSGAATLNAAKDQAVAAIVRQGWAPGGWRITC